MSDKYFERTQNALVISPDKATAALVCDQLGLSKSNVASTNSLNDFEAIRQAGEFDLIALEQSMLADCDEQLSMLQDLLGEAPVVIIEGRSPSNSSSKGPRYPAQPISDQTSNGYIPAYQLIAEVIPMLEHESRNALQRIQLGIELIKACSDLNPTVINSLTKVENASNGLGDLFQTVRQVCEPTELDLKLCSIGEVVWAAWNEHRESTSSSDDNVNIQLVENDHLWLDREKMVTALRQVFEYLENASGQQSFTIENNRITDSEIPIMRIQFRAELNEGLKQNPTVALALSRKTIEAHAGQIEFDSHDPGCLVCSICFGLPVVDESSDR